MGKRARRETYFTSQDLHGVRDEAIQDGPIGLHPSPAPKIKLWVVLADQVQLGYGRAQLLRTIDELGSIRKAAAQFGMSYRRVWGYLQELESAAGFRFLERRVGGWGHGGTSLTPEGRAFLAQYEAWREQVETFVCQSFAAHFPTHG
jgi:molybdate transport system regulatory protein